MYVYLLFANSSRVRNEPGKNNFDLRSVGWSSVTESIVIPAESTYFCTSCIVFLAVYGYEGGSYTIQASSTGVMRLNSGKSIGDSVVQGSYSFYSYINYDQFAEMSVSLTAVSSSSFSLIHSLDLCILSID